MPKQNWKSNSKGKNKKQFLSRFKPERWVCAKTSSIALLLMKKLHVKKGSVESELYKQGCLFKTRVWWKFLQYSCLHWTLITKHVDNKGPNMSLVMWWISICNDKCCKRFEFGWRFVLNDITEEGDQPMIHADCLWWLRDSLWLIIV